MNYNKITAMKNFLLLFLVFSSPIFMFSQEVWIPFKSEDFSFRANFERNPKTLTQDIPVDGNVFKMNMFYIENSLDSEKSNLLYAVAHVGYNKEEFLIDDLEKTEIMLNSAVDGSVKNVKGRLIFKNDIILNGFQGKGVKIEMQGGHVYARLYLVKHELYFVQIMASTDNEDNSDINKFFNSFDIIKVK